MVDLLLICVLLPVFIIGLHRPVVAYCTYIWIDMVMPQNFMYGFASDLPFSMISAAIFFISIMINKNSLVGTKSISVPLLLCFFAFWITMTTFYSLFPEVAWEKWDWAVKTIIAAVLMMFICNSRKDIEFVLLTITSALSYFVVVMGPKALLGGTGYDRSLIPGQVNFGLYESSTLAAVSASMIPIVFYLKNHSNLVPMIRKHSYLCYGFIGLLIAAVIGTTARTGLVSLTFLFCVAFFVTKKKIVFLLSTAIFVGLFSLIVTDAWVTRMDTIINPEGESSSVGRLVVWRWTIDFANQNFMGGGFHAYKANKGMLDSYTESDTTFPGELAFHSIYFEVLGEHGYIGIACFLTILALSMGKLVRMSATKEAPDWAREAAIAMLVALSTLLVGCLFVGIAFRPYVYYFVALAMALEKIYNEKDFLKS